MRADPIGEQIKVFMEKMYDQKEKELREMGGSLISSPKVAQLQNKPRKMSLKKNSQATSLQSLSKT